MKYMNSDSLSPDADFLTDFGCPATYRVNNVTDLPTVPKIFHDTTDEKFLGGVLDIGAQKSVIGLRQAQAYCQRNNIKLQMTDSNASFIFGDRVCRSLGQCKILVPMPNGTRAIETHVVRKNIPFLVGLDALDHHEWKVLTVENQLQSKKEGWILPLVRKRGHVFLTWDQYFRALYTRQQLHNMHLHFMHPSISKL
jgi:hypothetical protein